ncbi:MAG: mannose-1-phosphate guanylyltransferase/mannose-6-phosphate isomerase [Gammaproteobacteria bacterium]|nr:mannose-1-phosphate guanylyltransferase/mannose-6-phosphate isomerase [Gammaproteobacteria bacterium]
MMIIPVILSGGSGTRLWPLSRQAYPKQFLPLTGQDSLFQETLSRVGTDGDPVFEKPLIICNNDHRFLVAEQLRNWDVEAAAILLEPVGRNTAPAVACAALFALEQDAEAMMLVMPSDHVIRNTALFHQTVSTGAKAAAAGRLVTFGIVPDRPETGYGYIRAGEQADHGVSPVAEFVEKPDLETAKSYLESGDFFWNSGMFLLRAGTFLSELERLAPEMVTACRDAFEGRVADLDFERLDEAAFSACPSESIDYAVMEKTRLASVVPLDAGWSDVGAWSALWEVEARDEEGNVKLGDILTKDVTNSYLRSEHRMVAGVGLDSLVVVETADAVLVAERDRVQDVKDIVAQLKDSDRDEHQYHVRVFRPWGNYETVDESNRFKVKRIVVKPGEQLSLQMHHHRAEHWVVVRGTAKVLRGEDEMVLSEDQSVYIPLGTNHRLENPGVIPLEIIEVQTGSYLGEDDIVRFSDVYGRDKG